MDPHLRNSEASNSKQTYSNSYVPNKNQPSRNWANAVNNPEDLPPGIPSGYSGQYFYKKGQYGESKSFLPPSFQENPSKIYKGGEFVPGTSSRRFPKHTTIEPDQLLQQAFSNGQGVINPKFGDTFIEPGGPTQQTQPNFSFENPSGSFGVSKGFIPDNSFKPNHFPKEFPTKSRNSAEIPFRSEENFHSFTPTPTLEDSNEKNIATNAVEDIMNAIQHNQINCVSLLNEVGSKVKKKVDYLIKEVPTGKIKVFECVCVLDKDKIGFGKGNSKQGSKTDSATEGVRTLLSKEQFTYERAHITLSVQKTAGIGVYANQRTAPSTSSQPFSAQETSEKLTLAHQEHENDSSQLAKSQNNAEMDAALMNDSALYELNLIAKECFIEPHWIMSPPRGPNGEFETHVTFDKLEATGKGRKKLDAKRDAALKIIQQIRGSKDLSERYNPKASQKQLSPSNSLSELTKNDQRKILFESSLDSKMFGEIRNSSQNWKDNSTKVEKNFESYASNIKQKYELDAETFDALHEFFKLISDFSDMSTRNPKQILMDDPNHLADYVTDCSLVPIGSFALDCMRKDKLIIDALIVFQEVKRISEKDFLELYQKSLLECQRMTPQDNSEMQFKMDFSIESSDRGLCLLAKTNFKGEKIMMQIYVSNSSSHKKYDASIVHISKIYDSLNAAKLQTFRELMSLIRIWKTRNNLNLLSPELLDVVLLADFLTNQTGNLTTYIINCLITMSSEESFQAVLNKCGAYYVGLYKEIPAKLKWQISSKSIQSVEAIYQNHFDASLFN